MSNLAAAVRRTVVLVLIAVMVGAIGRRWHDRSAIPNPAPAVWPPFATTDTSVRSETPAGGASADDSPWRPVLDNGSVPHGHPVKVKEISGIYHVPGGRFYERTRPDRCYATTDDAEADGYRRSKA